MGVPGTNTYGSGETLTYPSLEFKLVSFDVKETHPYGMTWVRLPPLPPNGVDRDAYRGGVYGGIHHWHTDAFQHREGNAANCDHKNTIYKNIVL